MQSTPVRVSVVALGTITAISAYGFGRTSASTSENQSDSAKPTLKPAASKVPFLASVPSIAKQASYGIAPETSGLQQPTPTAQKITQPTVAASPAPESISALRNAEEIAAFKPARIRPISVPAAPRIARLSVDQLPIDSVITSALPTPAKPRAATPKMATPKAARQTVAFKTSQTPPPPPSSSNTARRQANEVPASSIDPEAYTLGAGDRIRVDVFNVPEYSREYVVSPNGIVNLYVVGALSVRGMSTQEAQSAIAAKYSRNLRTPRIDVTLLATRPLTVAVAGEIARPGAYTLGTQTQAGDKALTITRLIQQAGGVTQTANARKIQVKRQQQSGTPLTISVDLWELARSGDLRQDLILRDGDSVFIPANAQIDPTLSAQLATSNIATDANQPLNLVVVGAVMRPGPLVLARTGAAGTTSTSGSAMPTLTQALQQAGGVTPTADIRQIEVRRLTKAGDTQSIRLNLWNLIHTGDAKQDIVLQQGDTIVVPVGNALTAAEVTQIGGSTLAPSAIRVNVIGEVESPGTVQVSANTPLNQAILSAGGFNRRANRKSVQLLRLQPNGTVARQNITIDLSRGVDEQGNPILRNNDVIVVARSGTARIQDTVNDVGNFLGKLFPFGFLFR